MKSRPTTTFLQLLLLSLLKRVKVGLFTNRPTIYTFCLPIGLLFILSVPLIFPFWGGWAKYVHWLPSTFCPGGIAPPPPFRLVSADREYPKRNSYALPDAISAFSLKGH